MRLIWSLKGFLTICTVLIFFASCTNHPRPAPTVVDDTDSSSNSRLIDSCTALLHHGDVVLRTGNDMTSYMLSQLNPDDKTFSHCGIILMEGGKPYIYHSIGGEDNPDQKLMRDEPDRWFSPASNLGLGIIRYKLSDSVISRLTAVTHTMYREHRMFDMDFDLSTDDRLYCAEFVYKAFLSATADSAFLKPVTMFGFTYFPVDRLFMPPGARFICRVQYK